MQAKTGAEKISAVITQKSMLIYCDYIYDFSAKGEMQNEIQQMVR